MGLGYYLLVASSIAPENELLVGPFPSNASREYWRRAALPSSLKKMSRELGIKVGGITAKAESVNLPADQPIRPQVTNPGDIITIIRRQYKDLHENE
jgi:hypothetical protein